MPYYPSAPTIGSANADMPQQPYSALGDLFAAGMFQQPWTPPPPPQPMPSAGMQTLMPNNAQSTLRGLAPLMRGGLSIPFAGGTLSANASTVPYQPGSTYVGAGFRRQF